MLAVTAPHAGAVTGSEVEAAKARVEELRREIGSERAKLSALQARSAVFVERSSEAEGKLEQLDAVLAEIRADLVEVAAAYEAVEERLNERAHIAYMEGPASGLGFLLGASSFTDLTDRLEFLDATTEADADLANEAVNLRNQLLRKQRRQRALRAEQAEVVARERADLEELQPRLAEQQAILDAIAAKESAKPKGSRAG